MPLSLVGQGLRPAPVGLVGDHVDQAARAVGDDRLVAQTYQNLVELPDLPDGHVRDLVAIHPDGAGPDGAVGVEEQEQSIHDVFLTFFLSVAPQGLRGLAPQHPAELFQSRDVVRLDPGFVLAQAAGGLRGLPGLDLELPGPGGLLVNPQAPGDAVPAAVDQHLQELFPGEHPEQGGLALGVGLELLAIHAVGDVVHIRVDGIEIEAQLGLGLGVAQCAGADLGLAHDADLANVQLPVVLRAGAAPDVIGGADAVRHEVVPDGIVGVLAVGRSGAGHDALAVVGDGLPLEFGGEGGLSGLLDRFLHDDSPLS